MLCCNDSFCLRAPLVRSHKLTKATRKVPVLYALVMRCQQGWNAQLWQSNIVMFMIPFKTSFGCTFFTLHQCGVWYDNFYVLRFVGSHQANYPSKGERCKKYFNLVWSLSIICHHYTWRCKATCTVSLDNLVIL